MGPETKGLIRPVRIVRLTDVVQQSVLRTPQETTLPWLKVDEQM